jgi:acetyl-CoA C-acetyltransferase
MDFGMFINDGLWDVYNNFHMGNTGEVIAERFHISREDCDQFALWSHQKAAKATESKKFKQEIHPVEIPQKKEKPVIFDKDEGIRAGTTLEKLAQLKPVFKKDGMVTAGNASQITDGASAVIVTSKQFAEKIGAEPLATIVGYNTSGVKPEYVMEAPIPGVKQLLKDLKLSIDDIDLVEHNEAFSSASIAVMNTLDIPRNIFNVHGGAVALGHPIGCSGSRILITLIHAMREYKKHRGLATICLGGGNAVSMIVER